MKTKRVIYTIKMEEDQLMLLGEVRSLPIYPLAREILSEIINSETPRFLDLAK